MSVSVSSTLTDESIYKDPHNLTIEFITKLDLLAEQSKMKVRTNFQDLEVADNERIMKKIFDQLNERVKNYSNSLFVYEDECIEDPEEKDMST